MRANIAALDVGTTSVRCFIVNELCEVVGMAAQPVELLNPRPGYFEIEPEALWRKILDVINGALKAARLTPSQLTCLGLSTQRCTFLTWNHQTQEYFHNFITWKDLRSGELVEEWNSSYTLKTINVISYALWLVTRNNRFLAGSVLKMMNGQVTLRLLHEIQTKPKLRKAISEGQARVELLDSWILYKLRSCQGNYPFAEHITDISSSAATGLFDPFTLGWSSMIKTVFGIDIKLLPKIVENNYKNYGFMQCTGLGDDWDEVRIPIAVSVSDQTAAMWGSHCFEEGDVKVTMGTGAFLNLITGKKCFASCMGMYPLVAWQLSRHTDEHKSHGSILDTMYCVEGAAHDMGTVIGWAQACGLIENPNETSALAESVADTSGVYFIPAFSGLGPPINDHKATTGFIGITPSTKRAHLIRAILESIVYRLVQLCETVQQETRRELSKLRVDGGVSRNDFVCQYLADASGIQVERAQYTESSIMGVTYMAGLQAGVWPDVKAIRKFRKVENVFQPRPQMLPKIKEHRELWEMATERFGNWY